MEVFVAFSESRLVWVILVLMIQPGIQSVLAYSFALVYIYFLHYDSRMPYAGKFIKENAYFSQSKSLGILKSSCCHSYYCAIVILHFKAI